MSRTKQFLADENNYTEETRRIKADQQFQDMDYVRNMVFRERMVCADGFSMSVQYSSGHYCNGREWFMGGDMQNPGDPLPEPRSVEIGFPSQDEPLIADFAEEATRPRWVDRDWFGTKIGAGFGFMDDEAASWHLKPVANRIYDDLRWGDRLERWLVERFWPLVSNLTETVYGWVPVEVVDEVIAKHGGLKGGE